MKAELVGINGYLIKEPEYFGAQPHQLQGTSYEALVEVGGRYCYDSFSSPNSRSSKDYHLHIEESGHYSVWRHSMIRLFIPFGTDVGTNRDSLLAWCYSFRNEPGWYLSEIIHSENHILVCNLQFLKRVFKSYNAYSRRAESYDSMPEKFLFDLAIEIASLKAPLIVSSPDLLPELHELGKAGKEDLDSTTSRERNDLDSRAFPANSYWLSMHLEGSRSWSHEQVRHAFEGGPSQRSTRYVKEDIKTSFEDHPVFQRALDGSLLSDFEKSILRDAREAVINTTDDAYNALFTILGKQLEAEGVDTLGARKQARAAATRCLPHGLRTEGLFTYSLREWLVIFNQRISKGADEEIQILADLVRTRMLNSEQLPQWLKDKIEKESKSKQQLD